MTNRIVPGKPARHLPRIAARALLVALTVLGLAEIVLYLLPPPPFLPPAPLRGRPVRFSGERLVTVDYEMRTPPLPRAKARGGCRVLCCGSSSTYGLGLPPQGAWPWRLDLRAGGALEAVNLARVGATSSDQVEIVQAALALEPDAVVLMEGNNEFLPVMAATAVGQPIDARAERALLALCRASRVVSWLRVLLTRPASPVPLDAPAPSGLDSVQVTDDEIALVRDVYRENLRKVARLCRAAGVPLVICTVPVNLRLPPAIETDRHPLRTRPDFNAVARDVAAESGTHLCALDGFESTLFLDACHLNDSGSRRAAAGVWAALSAAGLGGRGGASAADEAPSVWVDMAHFGDVPSFLRDHRAALPATLADEVGRAYARHSSVSFSLADALPPIDLSGTRDLTTLALYGHIFTTAHRYARAAEVYTRASAVGADTRRDLGWARFFAGDLEGARGAWAHASLDGVSLRARGVLEAAR